MTAVAPPFLTLRNHLISRFGVPLRKISLDMGGSCPNRDGVSGYGGCVYCDAFGSGTGLAPTRSLKEQFDQRLRELPDNGPGLPRAIAYLQSYSNTYPDLDRLRDALNLLATRASSAPVLSVGTRPDCFSEEAAQLLASQRDSFRAVWVEFGLETTDDGVQAAIGRHDTLASFHKACHLARKHGLEVIAHTLCGLPGDRPDTLDHQVRELAAAGCSGVKFHQLLVLRSSILASWWRDGRVQLLRPEEYVERVCSALALLPPSVVVHRLVAAAPAEKLLAPTDWPPWERVHHDIMSRMNARASG